MPARAYLWRIFWRFLLLPAAALLVLAGCQPAERVSSTATAQRAATTGAEPAQATEAPGATTAAAGEEAYPTGLEETPLPEMEPEAAYPPDDLGEGPGPSGVIVVENGSHITARLIRMAPDAERPDFTRLRVEVLSSEDVPGLRNFTRAKVREEIDVLAETAALPELQPGENIEAEVSYRGDEHGGFFTASDVKKQGT